MKITKCFFVTVICIAVGCMSEKKQLEKRTSKARVQAAAKQVGTAGAAGASLRLNTDTLRKSKQGPRAGRDTTDSTLPRR